MNTLAFLLDVDFGWVTLSVLGLVILWLTSAGVLWGVQQLGKVLVNADHENAPSYNWSNPLWDAWVKYNTYTSSYNPLERTAEGGYYVRLSKGSNLAKDLHNTCDTSGWLINRAGFTDYCVTADYEKVKAYDEDTITTHSRDIDDYGLLLVKLLSVDLIILSAQHFFFPVVTVVGLLGLGWAIRTIFGKVYTNTDKIKGHSVRIDELEKSGEVGEHIK